MGLHVSAMIFMYDYTLSSPTSFINDAIAKMKEFSLDGFHLEYRSGPKNRKNLNNFLDFVDQFGAAMKQVNPDAMLTIAGGTCPNYGYFDCASGAGLSSLAGYMDEGFLSATTASKFQAIESYDRSLGDKYWPSFNIKEDLEKTIGHNCWRTWENKII